MDPNQGSASPSLMTLEGDARSVISAFTTQEPRQRRAADDDVRKALFASFEATRGPLINQSKINGLYVLFLIVTAAFPFAVLAFDDRARTVAWDAFSIISTVILLLITYGVYTVKMVARLFAGVLRQFLRIFFFVRECPKVIERFVDEGDEDEKKGAGTAFFNLALLSVGLVTSAFASWQVLRLYHESITNSVDRAGDNAIFAVSVSGGDGA